MLELKNIGKSYGKTQVLHDITLNLPEGVNVIIGLNGSGKSTLLKIIAGFIPEHTGSVILNGKELTALDSEQRYLGYVPQQSCLFPHLTVWENICYCLRNARGSLDKASHYLEMLDLQQYQHAYPRTLSGGFQSRVALARALTSEPKALLLDEPLSDLDKPIREHLVLYFKEILLELKIPVLYVTHDLDEADLLGSSFAAMVHGKLQVSMDARQAFEHIRHEFMRYFKT